MNWQPAAKAPMEPDASVTFESNTYLVTDGHRVATCDFARGNGAGKPWADWSMYGGIPAGRISHWMPLPEAPGESDEHEEPDLIDRAPEPFRRLGELLARLLDEDQWASAERLILAGLVAVQEGRDIQGDIDHYNQNMG